jgi:Protein of unknown function (DUF2490)
LKLPFTAVILLFTGTLMGQTIGLGTWNILNFRKKINEQWSVFAETQLRSLRFYGDFHYYEYKAGVHYRIHPQLQLSLAVGEYDTYGEGGNFVVPKNNDERRIWPQILLTQALWRVQVEQRYRAEFRFTSRGYRNRFRYRVGLNYPFGREMGTKRVNTFSCTNELFLTDRATWFERNRFAVNYSRRLSTVVSVQVGYLHQFDYRLDDEIGRDFLQVGLSLEW